MRIELELNGAARAGGRRRRAAARGAPPRRAAERAPDLRHRRLRRLHGARGGRADLVLPAAGAAGRRARRPRSRASATDLVSVLSRRGLPVRLLYARHGADRRGCSSPTPSPERDPRGAGRQPLPLRLPAHRAGGAASGGDAREARHLHGGRRSPAWSAARPTRSSDLGFDGDMVAFIAGGDELRAAPRPTWSGRRRVEAARLLAPLRPRTLRDFLTFEEHAQRVHAHPRPRGRPAVVRALAS